MGGYEKRPYTKRDESDSKSKDWVPKGKRIILKEEPIKLKSRKSAGDESDFYPDNVDVSIRLNRFLSNAGIASRREADVMITAGLVKVNGKIITELGTKVNPQKDEISYGDARVKVEKKVYVLINKPKNVITTTDDPEGRNTIMELVKDATKERIFPVGRLDRNTTGVLLLTNDGDLSNKLTHPKFGIKKVYIAQLDQNFKLADKQKLLEGVELEDGPIHADALEFKSTDDKKTLFVEIHSGRNRIVHRMFESLGYKVDKLDRTYFAGLTKTSLKRGQWRLLSEQEVNILRRQ
jgi:23S rRNA pseudouridine2605 synthase